MSGEEVKMVLEIINTLAIVIASIVAICSVNAWRKEFRGKRNIELAEEVLALFYEAKDAISAIRNIFGFQGEGTTRKPQKDETQQEKQARDHAYIVYERFDKRKEIFNKLYSKRYQFMARFGTDKITPFEDIREIVIEIRCAADELAELWCEESFNQEHKKSLQEQIKKQKRIFRYSGRNDPIVPRLEKVISDIEAICRPIIMGKKNHN